MADPSGSITSKYDFVVPTKVVKGPERMQAWMESVAYQEYLGNLCFKTV